MATEESTSPHATEQLFPTERVLAANVACTPKAGLLNTAVREALYGEARTVAVACVNSHTLAVAHRQPEIQQALDTFNVVLPDGISVVLASRFFGLGGVRSKYGGPDFFRDVMALCEGAPNASVFFLGSTESTLAKIVARCGVEYPNVRVAGTCSPPFRELTVEDIHNLADLVTQANPTVLWIGMTAPKQEVLAARLKHSIQVPLVGCVGAAFDYFAGTKQRPAWAVKYHLAWAYRLYAEPRRLWRRYFVSTPQFFYWVWQQTRLPNGTKSAN